MSEIKIYDCHNTNTINNTRKYVAYEDFIAYKEKAEAEVVRLKNFLREINDVACDFPSWWFESQGGYNSFQEELDELIKECDV